MSHFADKLVGTVLQGDRANWKVAKRLPSEQLSTGGHFSIGLIVKDSDGNECFLKAMDFTDALKGGDTVKKLNAMSEAFLFEQTLLERCGAKNLNRVVTALDHGTVQIDTVPLPMPFLVFELADGDVRRHMKFQTEFDTAWALRTLHHVAVGMKQLHGRGIAHQDLKPSNVLVFGEHICKLADLGCAVVSDKNMPHYELEVPGDGQYAAIELLYHNVSLDWKIRRIASDLYQIGSMANFLFTGVGMTPAIFCVIDPGHQWAKWRRNYEEVLPYVRHAFNTVIDTFDKTLVDRGFDQELRPRLVSLVRRLSDPDPTKRAHPNNLPGDRYSLERDISELNSLSTRTNLKLTGDWRK